MRPGLDVAEVEGLARVMTAKFMAVGIPCGGAKGGIDYDSNREDSAEVLKRYLPARRPFLPENWSTSEDLGTREEEIMSNLPSWMCALRRMPSCPGWNPRKGRSC